VAEHELNAIVLDKKINDELRGYKKPYESKVLANENTLSSVEALVATISERGFALSKDFYKAKAALHGVSILPYASRYDSIGPDPKISFTDAVEICRDVFYKTKHEYGTFFDEMLSKGHIDVYPRARRSGGAFMSSDVGQPTMVFLNQVDTFKSLETLAHEMGHAIHSSRSKVGQPSYYEHYSTTTAETASTFFENLVYDAVYEQVDSDTRLLLLHERIMRDIATIQRQIAFFNFECTLHHTIRTEGAMTAEHIASTLAGHLRAHLGPAISVTDDDGYSFVYIGHFRSMFYVYTYAYGLLMSNVMRTKLRNDPKYIARVDTFLQSGGSNTVEHIFKSIGIKANKHETFLASLEAHAADIKEFSRLVKKRVAR
jgi:oligoendopeptidase F